MLSRAVPKISSRTGLLLLEDICSKVLLWCNSQSLKEGVCTHSPILKLGLQGKLFLNNNLLSFYTKHFQLKHARQFFNEMPFKDVVSWTRMLSAYAQGRDHEEALQLFDMMKAAGQYLNEFAYSNVIRSCSDLGEFSRGTQIQADIIKHGFEANPFLASSLVDFYSKFSLAEEAYKVFANMSNGDTISWTSIITSFVKAQNWTRALQLYAQMVEAGVPANEYTFAKLLTACSFHSLKYGKLVHARLIKWGANLNLILKTALVDMYSKCKRMEDALKVSTQTPEHDVLSWTTIISGFARNLQIREAFAAFHEMVTTGIMPNNYTYSGILKACSSIQSLALGEQIHTGVVKTGLESDVSVGNALVNMYMKCSNTVEDALRVFESITSPNVISWTSLVAGLAEHGLEQESFQAFEKMRSVGEQPNSYTVSGILGACSTTKSLHWTRKLHGYIIKSTVNKDITVENALVDAYASSGMMDDARCVIQMMNHRDAITYTSLATRFNQMGYHEAALCIIAHMHGDDVKMDGFSLAGFLSASACLGAMEPGKQLHGYSVKSGLANWISVSNGLVDLYGKCGCIDDAKRAFQEISEPDTVSWNSLMLGLASNGHITSALSTFEHMILAGSKPDSVTFLVLLFTCSHGGLVDLGKDYFQSMRETHHLVPQLDHYVSLVDLLGRAGQLEEAMAVVETMPFQPNSLIYKTMLGACKLHGNIPLGEDMARQGLELAPSDPALYALLANMYDDFGRPDLGEKTRKLMRERGLRTTPGQSWMEVRNKVHVFATQDRTHPQINEIRKRINLLITEFNNRGYPYKSNDDSAYHSEKLAVAFGLLSAPSSAPIRIIKNTRICRDCHNFITNVTRFVDKMIIVRDGNHFHCFKKGNCSCKGNW